VNSEMTSPLSALQLSTNAHQFLTDYHLATLSTFALDGSIHVVAVGFTLHTDGILRIITSGRSQKVRNIERIGSASVGQVDGARWISLSGPARVATDADSVSLAVELYAKRYRQPRPNPERVTIEITVAKVLGSAGMRE
jgi:PPOX class probable F420-dependent enzyme